MKKKAIVLFITIIFISIFGIIFAHYNIRLKTSEKINLGKKNTEVNIEEKNTKTKEQNEVLYTLISEASYSKDPRIPENLLDVIDTHILKIKVIKILEGEILPKMQNYYNPYTPCTPIKVELIENIYGNNIALKEDIIYMKGGKIRISNLINHLDDVDIDRMGLGTLTEAEKENKFINYTSEFSYDIQEGKEFVVIVGKMDEGIYQIVDEGCGIFIEDISNNTTNTTEKELTGISLKNVITDTRITRNSLIEKAIEKNTKE